MSRHIVIVLALLVTLPCIVLAANREQKSKRSDLPPAVQQTVKEQSQGATIVGFTREREGGKDYFEAEMKVNGHSRDVLMDASGKIVEVEEEVALESLPAVVKNALQTQAGSGKISKVESITKDDHLVAYEAEVLANGKRREIQAGPDGQTLAHEE